MVTLIRPRNEAEFVHELKSWFLESNKGRAYFQINGGTSGVPDFLFGCLDPDGIKKQFHAEAKYVKELPRTLDGILKLMRDIQINVCLNMAAAGLVVFIIVCVGGYEACWYRFDPQLSYDAKHGRIAKYKALYLNYVSRRDRQGKWVLGEPADTK